MILPMSPGAGDFADTFPLLFVSQLDTGFGPTPVLMILT